MTLTEATGADLSDHEAGLLEEWEWGGEYPRTAMLACAVLAESDCVFRVDGFGLAWNVDVDYDLSTVMEDFPETLDAVRASQPCEIGFYAPSTRRQVRILPRNGRLRLTCALLGEDGPAAAPPVEWADHAGFERMLVDLAAAFSRSLARINVAVADTAPFPDWRHGRS
ncbi:MAG: hypothetical protein M0026_01965 [Nocardiopsaceae bacterium]|nr:hypothetical protein [Nocardiopsaceae bacterium]